MIQIHPLNSTFSCLANYPKHYSSENFKYIHIIIVLNTSILLEHAENSYLIFFILKHLLVQRVLNILISAYINLVYKNSKIVYIKFSI